MQSPCPTLQTSLHPNTHARTGIGVPAAAASGMITANTLAPLWSHFELLNALKI